MIYKETDFISANEIHCYSWTDLLWQEISAILINKKNKS